VLRAFRHLWLSLVAVTLASPLVLSQLAPSSMTSNNESRRLAPPVAWPNSSADWLAFPSRLNDYLSDHFGLRSAMIHAQSVITHLWLRSGDASVLIGLDEWLFFRGADAVEQSTGRLVREQRVLETADTIAHAKAVLAARGMTLIFASPPNAGTIYPDRLPSWSRPIEGKTEYALMLKALEDRGVTAVDLRPALEAAKTAGRVYFAHDTHWTARGALAAFDAIVNKVGHPDWRLDPTTALTPRTTLHGGDLARMLGLAEDLSEPVHYMTLPAAQKQDFEPPPSYTFAANSGRAEGSTILIIGDSFTETWYPPMLLAHAGRMALTHIQNCGFNWAWIDYFKPDQVWWMPTERQFLCAPGVRPVGMPG
jgi:alginate O-acetyltransferase complex protein AlgJ